MQVRARLIRLVFLVTVLFLGAAGTAVRAQGVTGSFRFVADGAVTESPVVEDDGTVYCVSDGGSLYRVGPDGVLQWSRRLRGRPRAFLRKSDGTLLIVSTQGAVEGYNPSGSRVVDFTVRRDGRDILSLHESAGGRIMPVFRSGRFEIYSGSGKLLAGWRAPAEISSPPLVQGSLTVCGLIDGRVLLYRGTGRMEREIAGTVPVEKIERAGDGSIVLLRKNGRLEVISMDGSLRMGKTLPDSPAGILVRPAGGYYIYGGEGRVYCLDGDGRELWNLGTRGGRPSGAALDSRENLFITGEKGILEAFTSLGSPLWSADIRGRPGFPAFSPSDRFLAVGGSEWVLHLFEFIGYGPGSPVVPGPAAKGPPRRDPRDSEYRGDPDFIFLLRMAESRYAGRKREVLDDLEKRHGRENFGRSLDYSSEVLRYLSAEPHIVRGRPNMPDIRIQALELLGMLGDSRDREFLAELLLRERDDAVLPAVLSAIAAVRSDLGEVMRRGMSLYLQSRPLPIPPRIAGSFLSALESIMRYHGSPGEEGKAVLLRLLSDGPSAVHFRIRDLLKINP